MTRDKKKCEKEKDSFCFFPDNFRGPPGPQGPSGPQGPPGSNGFENLPGQRGDYLRYYNDTVRWAATATSTNDNILIGTTTADSFSSGNTDNVAMGNSAGQGLYANPASTVTDTISIGKNSGGSGTIFGGSVVDLEKNSIAIGNDAGAAGQKQGSISIGTGTNSSYSQQPHSIAMGNNTSRLGQNYGSVMIGPFAGMASDVTFAGNDPSFSNEDPTKIPSTYSIGIGFGAANYGEGFCGIAVGRHAHSSGSNSNSIAIGQNAGAGYTISAGVITETINYNFRPDNNTIGIGFAAGMTFQVPHSIAIGYLAGCYFQGGIAIGDLAGAGLDDTQTPSSGTQQGGNAIAIGRSAGQTGQGVQGIAIGFRAGKTSQGPSAIAIGLDAGFTSQGDYSIAIGYHAGHTSQHDNSIIINASNSSLNSTAANACYINPIRVDVAQAGGPTNFNPPSGFNFMAHNPTTSEVRSFTVS